MNFILTVLLACLAFALVSAQSSSCTVSSSGCLGGMIVTSNFTANYAPCKSRITYTFTKLSGGGHCDISNFVTRGARPYQYLTTTCASDYGALGYNKIYCPTFGTVFGGEAYKIDTDGGCFGTVVVDMVVPFGDYVKGVIGLKGGTDCTNCTLMTYKPLATNTGSIGACATNADCNDNNACTVDTCNAGEYCSTCSNVQTDALCVPCLNDTDCASGPYIDACTVWACNQQNKTCEKSKIPGCSPCQTDIDCPPIGETGATCIDNKCDLQTGICAPTTIVGCCTTPVTTTTSVDSCYTCTKKTGCGFTDSLECVPTNSTSGLPVTNNATSALANCTTFKSGDGSSGDGGGTDGGTIAAIVVPVVAAVAFVALAAGVFAVALAVLIAKKMQKGAIAAQLQAIGFTENESAMIVNSAAYNGNGGENPFFISTDEASGARVLSLN